MLQKVFFAKKRRALTHFIGFSFLFCAVSLIHMSLLITARRGCLVFTHSFDRLVLLTMIDQNFVWENAEVKEILLSGSPNNSRWQKGSLIHSLKNIYLSEIFIKNLQKKLTIQNSLIKKRVSKTVALKKRRKILAPCWNPDSRFYAFLCSRCLLDYIPCIQLHT